MEGGIKANLRVENHLFGLFHLPPRDFIIALQRYDAAAEIGASKEYMRE